MAAAIDYLRQVGLDAIHQAETALTMRTHEILAGVDGARILGPPPDKKGGIVSFVVDGAQASDLALVMDERGVAVRAGHHCAMPLHARLGVGASTRASFYFYNTLDDVERFGDALTSSLRLLRRER
jgi:cysteine desulfurase/selenocysteine lyase